MTDEKYVLGIDVGGTNLRAGLVDTKYQLSDFVMESSTQIMDPKHAVEKLIVFIKRYLKKHALEREVTAVSIGFPSTIDKTRKKLLSTPNITGLDNIDIADELEKSLGIKIYINKDVNMLMLFDIFHENIPEWGLVAGFYFGTGLGNAISINGNLLIGKNGAAAELGHIPTKGDSELCGCGNKGCAENYASGKYLRKLCKEYFPETFIGDVFKNHKEDPVIRNFIRDLAIPVATEINILDPDFIILGGGVIQMESFPVVQLEKEIHEFVRKPYPEKNLQFVYSIQGQENGVIGAGIHGFKELKK